MKTESLVHWPMPRSSLDRLEVWAAREGERIGSKLSSTAAARYLLRWALEQDPEITVTIALREERDDGEE